MSTDSPLVRRTVACLSLTCLGEERGDMQMIHQGTKLYGSVLSSINEVLQNRSGEGSNANIFAAIQLCGLYEQFNAFSTSSSRRQSRGWQAHVLGMKRLIELAGPKAFIEERAFLTYQACQTSQFTAAYAARKGTSLASRDWRTIPWTGRNKSARDSFFDIAFGLPWIVEQAEDVDEQTPDSEVQNLLHQLHEVLARLDTWKRVSGLGRSADPWQLEVDTTPTGLRDAADYDLSGRQTGSLYCAVTVHITIVMHRLAARLGQSSFETESISLPDAFPYAMWITEAMPLVAEEGGIIGSQSVLFPMGATRWYIGQFSHKHPEKTQLVALNLGRALQKLAYNRLMEGFMRDIPTLRLNTLSDVKVR